MEEINTNSSLEEKCENLMNVVVETRKQFSKICINYDKKTISLENQILKLKLNHINSSKFKAKPCKNIPEINEDEMKGLDEFNNNILCSQQRLDKLRQTVKEMQSVVFQMKNDAIGKKLHTQITATALLAEAKKKRYEQIAANVLMDEQRKDV